MDKRQYIERGGLLAGVGSFVASVPTLVAVPGPAIIATTLTLSGVGIGIAGLAILTLPFLPYWEEEDPTVRRVTRNDLKEAYSFCNGIFADNFSSFNSVKKWFHHNTQMLWIIEKTKRKGPARLHVVTGFFSILPLTPEGKSMLVGGHVEGTGFSISHIAQNFSAPAAYYIGAIGARGGKSKGVALGALTERMSQLLETAPAPVYTRPTTRDGLRLARQQGFEAVDGSGTKHLNQLYVRLE